jgi:hypothetical protein
MTADTTAAHELELYATNTQAYIAPAIRTLSRIWRKDRAAFSLDRAIAYIDRYCLVPAAKQYRLEYGSMTVRWDSMFPKPTRLVAAESIARSWIAEFRLGNFWD